mgnify:CR=1 FL=1
MAEKEKNEKVEEQIVDQKANTAIEPEDTDGIYKVDLSKPPPGDEVVEEEKVTVVNEEPKAEEPTVEEPVEETPVLEEITVEDLVENKEEVEDIITESKEEGIELPEQLQKVAQFMEETGGDLNDYVNLNRDVSNMDDSEILDEYYRSTKSHLSPEERGYLLEDSFGYNEEIDDEKTIRMKKIALKEQVAEAKAHLDRQKSKYYEDIKAGSKLTEEQQKAIDFFNRHNKETKERKKLSEASKRSFEQKTNKVFNEDFKGFDYQVGDKRFRFNVKDVESVKSTQSDINNFVNKFASEDKSGIEDAAGYHKSLFTAMNADKIAQHFYEQGKADAVKNQIAKDKNIDMNPRKTHGEYEAGGMKIRVLGDTAEDFQFKIKSNKKKN